MDHIHTSELTLVGLLNTILVSVIGIIFATILGVIVGVARLSPNYLINQFAAFM